MSKLKEKRLKCKYSCDYMAQMLGISKTYYWQIENGTRRIPYNIAIKIAIFFETTPDYLFYEDTKSRNEKEKQT